MSNQDDSALSPSGAPLTNTERRKLIDRVYQIESQIRDGNLQKPRLPYKAVQELKSRRDAVLKEYYSRLPVFTLSRCPVCETALEQVFDPFGVDGFWWQEKMTGLRPAPKGCEHFRVLTGALNLNGLPPVGGKEPAYVGPPAPYVIPKALEMPTMVAVIGSIKMLNGYTAFPIAYFSTQPPAINALANPWTLTSCSFEVDGRSSFAYMTDPWDFDLAPWVARAKIRWIDSCDAAKAQAAPKQSRGDFPYGDVPGPRVRQIIVGNELRTLPPPNNETVNPFTD